MLWILATFLAPFPVQILLLVKVMTSPILVTATDRRYQLNATAETLIGSRGCAILLADAQVAPQHARITPSQGQFMLVDLGGGIRVNGQIIGGTVALKHGDVITVGQTELRFDFVGRPIPTGQPVRQAAPKPGGNQPPASLPSASQAARMRGEQILWEGRPSVQLSLLTALTTHYKLTTERILIATGLLRQSLEEVELVRVKDIRLEHGILQRLFSLGTITIYTIDNTSPVLELLNVAKADRVREAIRNAVRDEQDKRGVRHIIEIM